MQRSSGSCTARRNTVVAKVMVSIHSSSAAIAFSTGLIVLWTQTSNTLPLTSVSIYNII